MLNEVAGHKDGVSAYMLVYVDPSVAAEDAGVLRSEIPATLRTGVDNDNSLFAVAVTHWHEVCFFFLFFLFFFWFGWVLDLEVLI